MKILIGSDFGLAAMGGIIAEGEPRARLGPGCPVRPGSRPENGEEVGGREGGGLAENGFEAGGIAALVEGGLQILTDRKTSAQQNYDDRLAQTLELSLALGGGCGR